jgi:hypothetical protein
MDANGAGLSGLAESGLDQMVDAAEYFLQEFCEKGLARLKISCIISLLLGR